jgi:copper(I)-binding protein
VVLDGSGQAIVLQDLRQKITPDFLVALTFTFEKAGTVTVQVPVATPLTPLPRTPQSGVIEQLEPSGTGE